MKTALAILALLVGIAGSNARAQDTFSIVAVDPVTGEVGSAGASCVPFDVRLISALHPGVGAINTQASYHPANQLHASILMDAGHTPSEIIDSLVAGDAQANPHIRQFGIVTLAGGGASAAYTGDGTMDYKGHRTGPTYAVQGNILLGRQIIDSIADRYERATGPLADRLMYALLGARVAGADTRCMDDGTSSLAAYVRVARPGDNIDEMLLDLGVMHTEPSLERFEPLDSLLTLFEEWRGAGSAGRNESIATLDVAWSEAEGLLIDLKLERRAEVRAELFDMRARRIAAVSPGTLDAGTHRVTLATDQSLVTGAYVVRLTCGRSVITRVVPAVR